MDDKLAKQLSIATQDLRSLISITFDFGAGYNSISDVGAKDLIASLVKHTRLKNIFMSFSE